MNQKIMIGLGALAAGAAIMGGAFVMRNQENPFNIEEKKDESAVEDRQKIEKLWMDELKDETKYGFCLAEADINTVYADPILGASGIVEFTSKEVLLYSKEAEKFHIMSRQADFKYKGRIKMSVAGITMDEPVNESGKIDEIYGRNEMPLRLDYANKYIFSNPDTKESNWVTSSIGEEIASVMPHHGCAGKYPLDNAPGKDLLAGNGQILIDRDCREKDINGAYDGEFSFKCNGISYDQAMEIARRVEEEQGLKNAQDSNVTDNPDVSAEEKADASASSNDTDQDKNIDKELREAIKSPDESAFGNETIMKQLEQLKEMQADQSAR